MRKSVGERGYTDREKESGKWRVPFTVVTLERRDVQGVALASRGRSGAPSFRDPSFFFSFVERILATRVQHPPRARAIWRRRPIVGRGRPRLISVRNTNYKYTKVTHHCLPYV